MLQFDHKYGLGTHIRFSTSTPNTMDNPRPAKRQRTDTETIDLVSSETGTGSSTLSEQSNSDKSESHLRSKDIEAQLALLPATSITEILLSIVVQIPRVERYIKKQVERQQAAQKAKILSVEYASKAVWWSFRDHAKGSSSEQWDAAFDVVGEIDEILEGIVAKVTPVGASNAESRRNAMEAMRRIAKTIILMGGDMGYFVQKQYHSEGSSIVDAFQQAVGYMDEGEREVLMRDWVNDKGERFG